MITKFDIGQKVIINGMTGEGVVIEIQKLISGSIWYDVCWGRASRWYEEDKLTAVETASIVDTQPKLYPLTNYTRNNLSAVLTGEVRIPKRGEAYLLSNGDEVAVATSKSVPEPRQIAKLVVVKEETKVVTTAIAVL